MAVTAYQEVSISALSPNEKTIYREYFSDFQTPQRVYALLRQIPSGRVTTYKALSDALSSSPRAVGGALRNNPFAPEVPCHRVIASTGYIGGFQGDWRDAPSGINCEKKRKLLEGEGVLFDEKGMLIGEGKLWGEFRV